MQLDKNNFIVKPVKHITAVMMIEKYHYAKGAALTSVFTFGLFEKGREFFEADCLGVSIWLPPTKNAAASVCDDFKKVLSLTRLAVHPTVPKNACSFLLAQSRKRIKKDGRFTTLLTYADTYKNHTGAIYKADNWEYVGLTKPSPVYLDKNGKIMGKKRAGKNLTNEEMRLLGFRCVGNFPKHKYIYRLSRRTTTQGEKQCNLEMNQTNNLPIFQPRNGASIQPLLVFCE